MGDLKMPFVLSRGVDTLTHLPCRPWLSKLLQVLAGTPFGRERGDREDRGKPTEEGSASLCASEPGWQKGAPRSRLGQWNRSPAGSRASSASFPGPSPPSSTPARAAGWERRRTGTGEVCGNFSIPGITRAPGRSSWIREFESRGTPRFRPSLAVVRPVLKGLPE